jgi:hypothetical protein
MLLAVSSAAFTMRVFSFQEIVLAASPGSAYEPEVLEVSYFQIVPGVRQIKWENGTLIVRRGRPEQVAAGGGPERRVIPSEQAWRAIWKKVDEIGVWSWKAHYSKPNPLPDPGVTTVKLRYGGREVSSRSDDTYPERYIEFHKALEDLIGAPFR